MVALALVLTIGFGRANADSISLFTTGVDGSGNATPAGSPDIHYALTSSDDINHPTPTAFVVGNPPATWWPNNGSAQWIAPNPLQVGNSSGDAPGSYVYEMTFDLGANPSQESIIGDWATNTYGLIFLNGVYVNGTTNLSGPTGLTPFSIPSTANFVPGVNKLDFIVVNGGVDGGTGPTGLFVGDIRGTYTPGIPEPSSLVLAGLGVAGLVMYRWRRAQAT